MTSPAYVSGPPQIRKMSDFWQACPLDPELTCPWSDLYWAFLARHEGSLDGIRRMSLPLSSVRRRSREKMAADARVFRKASGALERGGRITPELVTRARNGHEEG